MPQRGSRSSSGKKPPAPDFYGFTHTSPNRVTSSSIKRASPLKRTEEYSSLAAMIDAGYASLSVSEPPEQDQKITSTSSDSSPNQIPPLTRTERFFSLAAMIAAGYALSDASQSDVSESSEQSQTATPQN